MPYITREDGEHFVIPSYRDVLTAKQKSTLKKEILLLSQSYGEYITLQRKGPGQYEVAFSPDTGYLLGETVWHQFKRPLDLIYCEAIPNTTEAILVIVKSGSVYLDGSFPLESIPEELIIFLTQQNNFEIYIYGDVPITQSPEEGKFSFETNSVKTFTVLDKPIFQTLPLLKIYQLQLVEQVLKSQGIGVFPTKQLVIGVVSIFALWMLYSYYMEHRAVIEPVITQVNPYQEFYDSLQTAAPDQEISALVDGIKLILTVPGWRPRVFVYTGGILTAALESKGTKTAILYDWAEKNNAKVSVNPEGIYISLITQLEKRNRPREIYRVDRIVTQVVDNLSAVYPGNHITLSPFEKKELFTRVPITIRIDAASLMVLPLIGKQLKDLPLVLTSVNLNYEDGIINGTIVLNALGS